MKHFAINCDYCGELLDGFQGKEHVFREHIVLRGTLSGQVEVEDGQTDHYFVTKNPEDWHHFCDFNCLESQAQSRRKYWEENIRNRMREETDGNGFTRR